MPDGVPELTLGYGVARWAMTWLVQPNGDRAGHGWEPTESQLRFLLWWYAVDDSGRWLFNHGVRRLPKGSGKSPFAAVVALAELCGPVRLSDFDRSLPGGCKGKPVDMPLVQIAATAESQTSNTMRMVRAFCPKGSRLVAHHGLDPGKTQIYRMPEGELRVITSSATAAEGAEASFVVADETELWKPSNGGVELSDTLSDNLAKSGSRMLETSNAWIPGMSSVSESSWDAWVAQEEGRYRGETSILYDARIAPPDTDMSDETSLTVALDHVYGDCWWVDKRAIMERIWSPRSKPDDSKRKYLNWPTTARDAWVSAEEWAVLARPDIEVSHGEEIVMFFDGSKSRDATALVGCRVSDGHVFTLGVWEPNWHDGETVDYADVDRVVTRAFKDYKVSAFFADVKEWESFVLVDWPNRWGDKLRLVASPHARPPQQIGWDMRVHVYDFAQSAEIVHSEIVDAQFTHDGNAALARHVVAARRRPYKDLVSIGKESAQASGKIDAAICMVGARMVRRLLLASTGRKRRGPGRLWL